MDNNTIERIKRSFIDPSVGPETIALMLTDVCNLDCLYCRGGTRENRAARKWARPGKELTTKELFALFDDARDFKVKEINLGGLDGDPFCKKDIIKIIQRIKRLGFLGSITTNGSFLTADIAQIMTGCNWDIMLLSLDSIEPDTQHMVRPALNGKPYFQHIIQFLDALDALQSPLKILLNVVISRFNYKGLPKILEVANRYKNIESVHVLKMLHFGQKDFDTMQLNRENEESFKDILRGLKNEKKLAYANSWLENTGTSSAEVGSRLPKSGGRHECKKNTA